MEPESEAVLLLQHSMEQGIPVLAKELADAKIISVCQSLVNNNGALSLRDISAAGETLLRLREDLDIIQSMQMTQVIIASSQNAGADIKVSGKKSKQVTTLKDLRKDQQIGFVFGELFLVPPKLKERFVTNQFRWFKWGDYILIKAGTIVNGIQCVFAFMRDELQTKRSVNVRIEECVRGDRQALVVVANRNIQIGEELICSAHSADPNIPPPSEKECTVLDKILGAQLIPFIKMRLESLFFA